VCVFVVFVCVCVCVCVCVVVCFQPTSFKVHVNNLFFLNTEFC